MANLLQFETSPYLLQHAENPVNWYPWGEKAFALAREQDKPVFLSIGYSSCHWCHVMARESFEDPEIADILNRCFVSVKVDREERPDVDSVYMQVCLALTGSGGWPASIFMTWDQKPFFAGSYFPKESRGGSVGLKELLLLIADQWQEHRSVLLSRAEQLVMALSREAPKQRAGEGDLPLAAFRAFRSSYDRVYGGFGTAPKFPAAHNLLFLLAYGRLRREPLAVEMAEQSLLHMIRGGLYDHVGGGFCRYSTDRKFLVPHFEKMLCDNALLILACCAAGQCARDAGLREQLLNAARKTGDYLLRELEAPEGGFYSAQDADSEGEEGKYYLFAPEELVALLGRESGEAFCRRYDVTPGGNFAGKSIPNLIGSEPSDPALDKLLPRVLEYRASRMELRTDRKILTAWNGLAIAALCVLYRVTGTERYLNAAKRADAFLESRLRIDGVLYASYAEGRQGSRAFLDDYAALALARLALYGATLEGNYLKQAERLCESVIEGFTDPENGGFFQTATDAERLLLRPKELYDGAAPSGNSWMAWILTRLSLLTQKEAWERAAAEQLAALSSAAAEYPAGYAMTMLARLAHDEPATLTVAAGEDAELSALPLILPPFVALRVQRPTETYPLLEGKTSFYFCAAQRCFPPTNRLEELKASVQALLA